MSEQRSTEHVDRAIVRDLVRWALVIVLLQVVFIVAMLRYWPFPAALDQFRGAFYVAFAIIIFLATAAITFLTWRLITMRAVHERRVVYLLLLPAVFLISAIVGFLLAAAPR